MGLYHVAPVITGFVFAQVRIGVLSGMTSSDGYGTGKDEEPYHELYVRPRWEPPTVHAMADDYLHHMDEDDLCMLRRGAALQMIDMFEMSYTHEHGLWASVDNGVRYLSY